MPEPGRACTGKVGRRREPRAGALPKRLPARFASGWREEKSRERGLLSHPSSPPAAADLGGHPGAEHRALLPAPAPLSWCSPGQSRAAAPAALQRGHAGLAARARAQHVAGLQGSAVTPCALPGRSRERSGCCVPSSHWVVDRLHPLGTTRGDVPGAVTPSKPQQEKGSGTAAAPRGHWMLPPPSEHLAAQHRWLWEGLGSVLFIRRLHGGI